MSAAAAPLRALVVTLGLLAGTGAAASPPGMVRVGGGEYRPLYAAGAGAVIVEPFYLDVTPVTNGDFLAFVRANPRWRRSAVRPLFADAAYLSHWEGDLDAGDAAARRRPVTNVSWFAATAYARWRGRRLPTIAEWEFAAAAGRREPDGRTEAGLSRGILAWYSRPRAALLPPVGATPANYWGARDMHGLVFEWVADFTSALVTSDSRRSGDADGAAFCGAGAVGAGVFDDYAAFLRFAFRGGLRARYAVPNLGFRTALDARQHSPR